MLPISRFLAVPMFILFGGASVSLLLVALDAAMRVPPVLAGLALGGAIVAPGILGVSLARSLANRISVTVAAGAISFPLGLHLVMGLFPDASDSLWSSFAAGLPVGVPMGVGILLAHVRALEMAPHRFRIALVYLMYGSIALIFPSLHFAFKHVSMTPSIHVLLWGGGLTVMISQALAMTVALRLRTGPENSSSQGT